MKARPNDTIVALSSGVPPAGIAIVRMSGNGAFDAAARLAGPLPPPRRAALRTLARDDGLLLDHALVLTFAAPASATGEDVVELHLHGGRAVVRAVLDALTAMAGVRAADPGEFTRRALMNGRIDLTEAEGLGDLLAAETEAQRRAAIRMADGALRQSIERWTDTLLALAAEVEALIDHEDEGDVIARADAGALAGRCRALAAAIAALATAPAAERLRDGIRLVLAGPPNSGKSSLFNRLAAREAAIVTPIAGTTRDRIEAPVVHGGVAWLLTDTAGLAEATADPVEAIGIARSRDAMAAADLVLWLGDDSPPAIEAPVITIHARADAPERVQPVDRPLAVSAATGAGIERLWAALHDAAKRLLPPPDAIALNARQRVLLRDAAEAIDAASREADLVIVAEHLRSARAAFDAITGRAGAEALLDALFASFCIGK